MKTKRISVSIPSDGTGLKTEAMWLAEALGAQWSHRRGYTLASAKRVSEFQLLLSAKFEASRRYFSSDRAPYTFRLNGEGEKFTLSQALKHAIKTARELSPDLWLTKTPHERISDLLGAEGSCEDLPAMNSSPLPWHTDPHVRYYLLDANGRLVADFNPPYLRIESERAQSEANAKLAALQSQYHAAVEAVVQSPTQLAPFDALSQLHAQIKIELSKL